MRKHPCPQRHFVVSVLLAAAAGLLCESALAAQGDAETGVWPIERTWTNDEELSYSEWVAGLFATHPDDKRRGWRNLAAVLRDPERNSLWGSLGLSEDDVSSLSHVKAKADCADVPYTLRAYYAWKRRLPLRYSRCTRGDGRLGPRCTQIRDNRSSAFDHIRDEVARWNAFVRGELVFAVHSGTLRTLPNDETSDFYPLPLSKDAIRPGTVFVDVGSHVLVVTGWDDAGPTAIDGHPDGTVTIKRFSEKSFPYYRTLHTGGFKAFRPIAPDLAPLSNAALGPQWSTEQYELGSSHAFYEAMASLP